jgi:AhpD family alkylhydroperoxidase
VDDAREFLAQSGLDVDEIAPHIDGKFMSAFVCARKPLTVTRAPRLSHKEKELVAVGAAVAAGCRPCTEYHMKEVQAAGATTEEITHALDAALCVKGSTTGIMERVAYAALGRPKDAQPACCSGPTDRMKELVSIGAAVAVNCPENFQKHVETSRAFGVREEEIRLVIGLAKAIRSKASEKMDAAATNQSATAQEQTESCCGATSAQQKTEQTEPTAGTCCGPAVSRQSPAQATPTTKGSCC